MQRLLLLLCALQAARGSFVLAQQRGMANEQLAVGGEVVLGFGLGPHVDLSMPCCGTQQEALLLPAVGPRSPGCSLAVVGEQRVAAHTDAQAPMPLLEELYQFKGGQHTCTHAYPCTHMHARLLLDAEPLHLTSVCCCGRKLRACRKRSLLRWHGCCSRRSRICDIRHRTPVHGGTQANRPTWARELHRICIRATPVAGQVRATEAVPSRECNPGR